VKGKKSCNGSLNIKREFKSLLSTAFNASQFSLLTFMCCSWQKTYVTDFYLFWQKCHVRFHLIMPS